MIIKEADVIILVKVMQLYKKHCNFFVNNGKAKASDIEKLIQKVRKKFLIKLVLI